MICLRRFFLTYFSGKSAKVRHVGTCVGNRESPPCGLEAACKQTDINTYECLCPHDKSEPTEDMKCPKRHTGKTNKIWIVFFLLRWS